MSKTPHPKSRTKPSNRLSHGLTSRAMAEGREAEMKALARELIKDAPATPEVQAAAEDLAGSMLTLHAIRRARIAVFSQKAVITPSDLLSIIGMLERCNAGPLSEDELRTSQDKGDEIETDELLRLLKIMTHNEAELRRLEDYERKAHSRYRKHLTHFDYAITEARRAR